MSDFPYITDSTLRHNLDTTFNHIADLLALVESKSYKGKDALVSSLRKTIIIHTAAIIEALLLWKVKQLCKVKKIEMTDEWNYHIQVLHKISSSQEVIAGKRTKEKKEINRLDFVRVIDLCYEYQIITDIKLKQEVDKVRRYRNRLHIGGLTNIESTYQKLDLEFCFNVLEKVEKVIY